MKNTEPDYSDLLSVDEITTLAKSRWIIPRSKSRMEYLLWDSSEIYQSLTTFTTGIERVAINVH